MPGICPNRQNAAILPARSAPSGRTILIAIVADSFVHLHTAQRDSSFHFTLLLENDEGYRNLAKLGSYLDQENRYAFGIPTTHPVATNHIFFS